MKKPKSHHSWPLLIALVIVISGCRVLRPSSAGVSVASYHGPEIQVNSVYFDRHFQVTHYATSRDANDRLRVSISMRNLRGDSAFEYRYRWLDANGIEVPSNLTLWSQMSTGGGEVALLTGMAPHREVTDFILDIRLFHASTRW